jgi:hypothetical protein
MRLLTNIFIGIWFFFFIGGAGLTTMASLSLAVYLTFIEINLLGASIPEFIYPAVRTQLLKDLPLSWYLFSTMMLGVAMFVPSLFLHSYVQELIKEVNK